MRSKLKRKRPNTKCLRPRKHSLKSVLGILVSDENN